MTNKEFLLREDVSIQDKKKLLLDFSYDIDPWLDIWVGSMGEYFDHLFEWAEQEMDDKNTK